MISEPWLPKKYRLKYSLWLYMYSVILGLLFKKLGSKYEIFFHNNRPAKLSGAG